MDNDVAINLDAAREGKRGRALWNEIKADTKQIVERWIGIGEVLRNGRLLFPDNRPYGAWKREHGLDEIHRNDCSGAMNLYKHASLVREWRGRFTETAHLTSPRLLWPAMTNVLTQYLGMVLEEVPEEPEPALLYLAGTIEPQNTSTPETPQNDPVSPEIPPSNPEKKDEVGDSPPLSPRTALAGVPGGQQIGAHFLNPNTRALITKMAGNGKPERYRKLLDRLHAGALGEPTDYQAHMQTVKLFFPTATRRDVKHYGDLAKKRAWDNLKADWDLLEQVKDEDTTHIPLFGWVAKKRQQKSMEQAVAREEQRIQEVLAAETVTSVTAVEQADLAHEPEEVAGWRIEVGRIVVCDETVWPLPEMLEGRGLSYLHVWALARLIRDWNRMLKQDGQSPQSREILIRNWGHEFALMHRALGSVCRIIAGAIAKNPEGKTEIPPEWRMGNG